LLKGTASEPALSGAEWVPEVFIRNAALAAEVRFLFREALFHQLVQPDASSSVSRVYLAREKIRPLCRRQERNPKLRADPRGDQNITALLRNQVNTHPLYPPSLTTFFVKNSPKIACQVQKPHNSIKPNEIWFEI
jgi:hypothetical protein